MHPDEKEALEVIHEVALGLKIAFEKQVDGDTHKILDLPPAVINSTILYNLASGIIKLFELSVKPVKQNLTNLH
jgi:hypothetical protein